MSAANGKSALFREIAPRNLLSYGPDTQPIELQRLNVLIGPNGSGKSNLIQAIALLRAAALDRDRLRAVISRGGGAAEWVWKGNREGAASIETVVRNPVTSLDLRHVLSFREQGQRFALDDERIEGDRTAGAMPLTYYDYQQGHPVLRGRGGAREVELGAIDLDASILSQRRDPEMLPEISYLAGVYEGIGVYREWHFGRNSPYRQPQMADLRRDRLEEDCSNLALFLNRLRRNPSAKRSLLEGLRDLYAGVRDFDVSIEGGTVQMFIEEDNEFSIPATRLSDGTLRYLCLLAILCDPDPPPLICIEEPELGLHPDIIPKIADLLTSAADRAQLIVTTHSDILVDALSEQPDSILVCEKHEGQTTMKRLDQDELAVWLEKYRLGELWLRGQLGGTRW